ncbi:hypothetical protein LCGC14_1568700 [marine sediment metagenome]|uniref:DRTGG domain-containing protein n=1 Tax=marine sediment metagenome TaxID=412755 RepID=A0A0F9J6M1_9ZZZZ
MNLAKIKEILKADLIVGSSLEREIKVICACDLMSDVLTCVGTRSHSLLLTNLIHPQAVRTAEIAEIPVICFVRGKEPQDLTMDLAKKNGIVLLSTSFSLYEASGRLYKEELSGRSQYREAK